MRIRKKPTGHPSRPYVYRLKRGKEHVADCTTEETAKFLASLLLTTSSVSGTIRQHEHEQGA